MLSLPLIDSLVFMKYSGSPVASMRSKTFRTNYCAQLSRRTHAETLDTHASYWPSVCAFKKEEFALCFSYPYNALSFVWNSTASSKAFDSLFFLYLVLRDEFGSGTDWSVVLVSFFRNDKKRFHLLIISCFLTTFMFDWSVLIKGEFKCWLLLRVRKTQKLCMIPYQRQLAYWWNKTP